MKKYSTLLFILFSSFYIYAQENYFSKKDGGNLMPVGAYYYPEHWDKSEWERDLKKMSELGFSFTHFAEFAWAQIEPEDGRFDFEWLDRNVELAHKYGLKIIMCTPSPAPPAWLTEKHPEVLLENADGLQQQHGSRLAINSSGSVYMHYVERVVTEMAKRYGNDKRIWGWQLDNEPHFGTLYDYSETALNGFREWLKNKYSNDIYALNNAWGASFWSNTYNHFGQIKVPNAKRSPQGANPHELLDFQRYTADALAATLRHQKDILRKYISKEQWITTNYAYYKFLPSVDLFRNRGDLDFSSHTMYLTSTSLNYPQGELNYRLGSGMELSFSAEMAKSVHGYTGIMELQPGQINWGSYNAQPYPGAVRMWVWHCFGLNDRFVCTYRFRQPVFGGEQYHKGIMETDGITPARGGREFIQAIKEIKTLKPYYKNPVEPASLQSRKTAFMWKQDNLFEMELVPHNQSWDTWQHYYTYYQKLKTMGCPVHFVTENEDINPGEYPFLVVPAYNMISGHNIEQWEKYVKEGGHLILTCRTGQKDNNGHLHKTLLQQPVWDLIGATVEDYDHLPPEQEALVSFDGKQYKWNIWGEWLKPFGDTETWGRYESEFYKGIPSVTHRRMGKGTVTYIGVWTKDGEMEENILRKVFVAGKAKILDLPDYVFVEWRDGFRVAVNYSSVAVKVPVPDSVKPIIGKAIILPGEVCVWQD